MSIIDVQTIITNFKILLAYLTFLRCTTRTTLRHRLHVHTNYNLTKPALAMNSHTFITEKFVQIVILSTSVSFAKRQGLPTTIVTIHQRIQRHRHTRFEQPKTCSNKWPTSTTFLLFIRLWIQQKVDSLISYLTNATMLLNEGCPVTRAPPIHSAPLGHLLSYFQSRKLPHMFFEAFITKPVENFRFSPGFGNRCCKTCRKLSFP